MDSIGKSQEINVKNELEKLVPTQRLLDHYRNKIAKFENDHRETIQMLDKYEAIVKPSVAEDELKKLTKEMLELRSALSDVNVFLLAERQQVVRFHAENERLELNLLESEKRVALLLSLCALSDGEMKALIRDPKRAMSIRQRLPPFLRDLDRKLNTQDRNSTKPSGEMALMAKVASLESQIAETEANWLTERSVLLQERTLATEESRFQRDKDEAHMKSLAARLEASQVALKNVVMDSINRKRKHRDEERNWLAERDHLLTVLTTVKERIPILNHLEGMKHDGNFMVEAQTPSSSCQARDLRRENEKLKRQLKDAEQLRNLFETRTSRLEQELCKYREQKEAADSMYKDRSQKMQSQLQRLQQHIVELDERRKSDVQGFLAEIRLIKAEMKSLIGHMYKVVSFLSGPAGTCASVEALPEMQSATALARTIQAAIGDAKRKILTLEGQSK